MLPIWTHALLITGKASCSSILAFFSNVIIVNHHNFPLSHLIQPCENVHIQVQVHSINNSGVDNNPNPVA
ncbi:hypothetical protein I7I48_06253 [Histoplasma ohiense]|nr:hypothetical protein I7I48_06253 [Histoplasma ohiense (nom. inval.)]